MKSLTSNELALLIDISAVRADSSLDEVNKIIESAKQYHFVCVFPMQGFVPQTIQALKGYDTILVGGVVGFPSGGDSTASKLFQAQEMKIAGCREIDMVMNIGKLKSGLYTDITDEIRQVKAKVSPLPLKVIIEVPLLTDDEIGIAASLVLEAGADFVKTGTGWAGNTTMHHVNLIKAAVGDKIKLKVAGGVRTLEALEEMYNAGVCRFGIGYKSALSIMEACVTREQHG